MNVSNASAFGDLARTPHHSGEGPTLIATLYLDPPWWLVVTVVGITVVFLLALVHRLSAREWRVSAEEQYHMLVIAGTVVSVGTGTLAFANLFQLPYAVDAVGGFLLGYGAIVAIQSEPVVSRARERWEEAFYRRAICWTLLAYLAFLLPPLVAVRGKGIQLPMARMLLVVVATAMVFLNARMSNKKAASTSDESIPRV